MTREEFTRMLEQEGFGEIVLVEREPYGALDTHIHPFEGKALILAGEIRIESGTAAMTYRAGDVFHLAAHEPHTESYGPTGVRYVVGRR